ncbi:hypothetical protein AB4144_15510 [Rhizobiaceae sp. 2RAB30]
MFIVYVQAGWLGGAMIGGHASVALLAPNQAPKYISWVTTVGRGGTRYVLDHFSKGSWSPPLYRIQIPTAEDGIATHLSVRSGLDWWNNGLLAEASAHDKKWNKTPDAQEPRKTLSGEYNCSEMVRNILLHAGAKDNYDVSWKDASTPFTVAQFATGLHLAIGDSIQGRGEVWPNETAGTYFPGTNWNAFFRSDDMKGHNSVPFPREPHPGAP